MAEKIYQIYDAKERRVVETFTDWNAANKRTRVLEPAPSLYEPAGMRDVYRYRLQIVDRA